ncbi:hypothetical protein EMCRGX_G021043 [Ephydatia muelleri]
MEMTAVLSAYPNDGAAHSFCSRSRRMPLSEPSQLNTRELLQCNLEQLVSDINTKRKRDTTLLEDFKKDLELLCSAAYSSMQAALYSLYEQNSKVINDKLEELMSVMETIATQEEELEQFKREMGAFLSDLQQ